MDAVLLARLQFALTIGFHYLFPPITIGLAWLLVFVEWRAWRSGEEAWERVGRFFGRIFALTFAVGVATGIVMEFQFGTNWASYSRFVGDIFGAPLAAEGLFSFFLESSFLGLYLFGRRKVSRGVHWFSILMVAVGATFSAFWILVANSWQQTPAGFIVQNGRAELTSFYEAVFNPSMWPRFFHTVTAALLTGAFFMAGISAWLVLKGKEVAVARRSLRVGVIAGLVWSVLIVYPTGHEHASQVAQTQPEKFAAIEGMYGEGQPQAPLTVFGVVLFDPLELAAAVKIPGMLSLIAFGDLDAHVMGLKDFPPDEVPQGAELWLSFVSFHNMVALGMWFLALTALAALFEWRGRLVHSRWLLWLLVGTTPFTLAASQFGWVAAEVGRQPWIVYKLLRTSEGASVTVSAGEILFSIILFGLIYLLLGALWIFLLWKKVNAGPPPLPAREEVAS